MQALKALTHHVNLLDSELVKGYLAKAECSINRKGKICEDLDRFYKYKGIGWTEPNYQRIDTLPFVPTTQEANDLIACLGPKMSVFALLLKETGCRFNECFGLRWQDINVENNTVTITPLKGSYARQMKVTPKLMGLLNSLPKNSRNPRRPREQVVDDNSECKPQNCKALASGLRGMQMQLKACSKPLLHMPYYSAFRTNKGVKRTMIAIATMIALALEGAAGNHVYYATLVQQILPNLAF